MQLRIKGKGKEIIRSCWRTEDEAKKFFLRGRNPLAELIRWPLQSFVNFVRDLRRAEQKIKERVKLQREKAIPFIGRK